VSRGVGDAVREEWRAFAAFVRAPTRHPPRAERPRRRLGVLLGTFVLLGLLVGLALWPVIGAAELQHALDAETPLRLLVLGVIVAPVLEEVLFRAGLRSLRWTLLVGPSAAALFAGSVRIALVLLVCGLLALGWIEARVRADPVERVRLCRAFLRRYPLVVWTWAAAFALVHVGNWWPATPVALAVTPLLVLPQFAMGLVLAHLRLGTGLTSAVALHVGANAAFVGLSSLLD
jgi:membrane protease YdiL (CAAX protease family)